MIAGPHTHVVTLAGSSFPATQNSDGLLVDLRLYGDRGEGYYPERLRAIGISETLIEAAGESVPAGFVLMK